MPTRTYRPSVKNAMRLSRGRNRGVLKTCEVCATWFAAFYNGGRQRRNLTRFCSVNCVADAERLRQGVNLAIRAESKALARIAFNWKVRPEGFKGSTQSKRKKLRNYCQTCKAWLPNRKTGRKKKYCGPACKPKTKRPGYERDYRRRAKHWGVEYEPIRVEKLFEFYGWACAWCGVSTPKSLRGTDDESAPELDHIIPISRNGGHTWDNVQLLCRSCNSAKGNSTDPVWNRAYRPPKAPGGMQKLD